jgi:hypothetical protein
MKLAFQYQNSAENVDATKQANCATKPLKLSVQKMKKNTWNYAPKAAQNVEKQEAHRLKKPRMSLKNG